MMQLKDLNAKPATEFVAHLSQIFEHSPWVVEAAAEARPFATIKALQAACENALYAASPDVQGALIRAHPDLAAKLDQLSELTEFSRREQDRAGFMRLDPETLTALRSKLTEYRERFGHPFILCVSEHAAGDVLPILEVRVRAEPEAERLACLFQIARIGWHRICTVVEA
ncbi:MAG: 2-oxo-4-hydroxy-4-carboxy-5-ureidoimidazoline decarboxylase [Verrucomicrobia bacterium]|jgi:OHCU decarboxylase|nr:2-oxo-4-hydroxy-4-carboxy-5-ureidoimidazoline decarboxylase [Verrucomicrobiota bacterium]